MITVRAYKTFLGETRVMIAHSAGPVPAENGMPGVRTTLLNEAEARTLLDQLATGLANPYSVSAHQPGDCYDCGSELHRTGSVFCAEANKEEVDAD